MKPVAFFTCVLLAGLLLTTACTSSADASTTRAIQGIEEAQRVSDSTAAVSAKDTAKTANELQH